MATSFASFSTPTLYKLIFLSPNNPATRIKCSLSKSINYECKNGIKIIGTRIRVVRREESVVVEEGGIETEITTKLNGRVNGSANGNYGHDNGSVEKFKNKIPKIESENGSLAKYVNGNGKRSVTVSRGKETMEVVKMEEGLLSKLIGICIKDRFWICL